MDQVGSFMMYMYRCGGSQLDVVYLLCVVYIDVCIHKVYMVYGLYI